MHGKIGSVVLLGAGGLLSDSTKQSWEDDGRIQAKWAELTAALRNRRYSFIQVATLIRKTGTCDYIDRTVGRMCLEHLARDSDTDVPVDAVVEMCCVQDHYIPAHAQQVLFGMLPDNGLAQLQALCERLFVAAWASRRGGRAVSAGPIRVGHVSTGSHKRPFAHRLVGILSLFGGAETDYWALVDSLFKRGKLVRFIGGLFVECNRELSCAVVNWWKANFFGCSSQARLAC